MPNFWPKGCTFYKSKCGYCDIFHNPVLQLTFKNCILYDCTDDSIHCRVLTGACSYTAGITKQSCLTKTTVEIRHFMIPMNVLTLRPTLLTGDSNCAQEQRKSRLYDCGVWTSYAKQISVSFNVLMTLVIGRVHRWHETNCVRWWAVV